MQQKQNKMGVMPIPKLLLTMAIPLMLSLLVQSLYNIVDSIYVSRISEKALTATSLAYPVQILISIDAGIVMLRYTIKHRDRLRRRAVPLRSLPGRASGGGRGAPSEAFFVGVQFHPEFKSRPNKPHPLFVGFIGAALRQGGQ